MEAYQTSPSLANAVATLKCTSFQQDRAEQVPKHDSLGKLHALQTEEALATTCITDASGSRLDQRQWSD